MQLFKEEILHHIFQYKLFNILQLKTINDEPLEILKVGTRNVNAGPDFLHSLIKIGDTRLAGNIEIHINSSDWTKHNHQNDKAYDNVILHVVYNHDKLIVQNKIAIPTLVLKGIVDESLFIKYDQLNKNKKFIPCETSISKVPQIVLDGWIDRMLAERIEDKASLVNEILRNTNNSWEETFYQLLSYTFGFGLNKQVFLKLAQSLPLNILAKHKNNLFQIEALIFGTAGLLNDFFVDEYPKQLQNEYQFLRNKYSLNNYINKQEWIFAKMHPSNFPTIRLAQFSKLVFQSSHLFSKIIACKNSASIQSMFQVDTSEYWESHYVFEKSSTRKIKNLGGSAIDLILINTIVPTLYFYAKSNAKYRELSMNLLLETKAENNTIIRGFDSIGLKITSAYSSQALLHLKNNYCANKKCLNCAIGNYLIKN
jgi:hypothetical protein